MYKTFQTLIFGVNSTAVELQHALQSKLADMPGMTNIADDILTFAEKTKQHDENLTRVLERYESKDITLNLEKSVFCKNNLKYYGFMFSKKGMKPDPEKIQEIQKNTSARKQKSLTKFSNIYTRL